MVSIYTQTEFILFTKMNRYQLADMLRGNSIDSAMNIRNNLQISMAEYARKHKYDHVQEKAIAITSKIEKWCKQRFLQHSNTKILPKKKALEIWEQYAKARSY